MGLQALSLLALKNVFSHVDVVVKLTYEVLLGAKLVVLHLVPQAPYLDELLSCCKVAARTHGVILQLLGELNVGIYALSLSGKELYEAFCGYLLLNCFLEQAPQAVVVRVLLVCDRYPQTLVEIAGLAIPCIVGRYDGMVDDVIIVGVLVTEQVLNC